MLDIEGDIIGNFFGSASGVTHGHSQASCRQKRDIVIAIPDGDNLGRGLPRAGFHHALYAQMTSPVAFG